MPAGGRDEGAATGYEAAASPDLRMLRRLYDWTLSLAGHRHAAWWLLVVSTVECSVFPIPVEAMLLPMMFATPRRAWRLAGLATLGSLAGCLIGYAIGALLYDSVGRPILQLYGQQDAFRQFSALYREWGAWIVVAGGFTPIPFKVVTIASGVVHLDLVVFVAASVASRGLRFAIEAALLSFFGPPIRDFVERRLALVAGAGFALAVAGFTALGWLWQE
jgi:membrane protein YqaA with SNARE-associated domain